MSHLLFLSHAGVDSEAALSLADRLEAAPQAREYDLKVWIDKRDLSVGKSWKKSLQDALNQSTAFAVYVGSRGVVNWVWEEVSVALDRAHADSQYPLIPIFAADSKPIDLPGFLSQYQGVTEPGGDNDFSKLLRAVLRLDPRAVVETERDPFIGLRAYDSGKAHLFFGRDQEVEQLLGLLRQENLVMVVGDSGSGKSSLARAGLIPAFRGGRLAHLGREGPDDTVWHTVETRPGNDPFARLADDLRTSALRAGFGPQNAGELADMVRQSEARAGGLSRSVDRVRDALLSSAPASVTRPCKILFVVDQFEELATSPDAGEYVRVLLRLADPQDDQVRVVITMRRDYYYLCASFEELHNRLEKDGRRARYVLQRMSPDGLRDSIVEPLRLAGVGNRVRDDLATAILKDVSEQAGELALLQMALWRTWSVRQEHSGNLLSAYGAIGRVDGALAQAAGEAFADLPDEDRVRAETLFVRLVRPGESGSVVRRVAGRKSSMEKPRPWLASCPMSGTLDCSPWASGPLRSPTSSSLHSGCNTSGGSGMFRAIRAATICGCCIRSSWTARGGTKRALRTEPSTWRQAMTWAAIATWPADGLLGCPIWRGVTWSPAGNHTTSSSSENGGLRESFAS
jgi:hypothetical protein